MDYNCPLAFLEGLDYYTWAYGIGGYTFLDLDGFGIQQNAYWRGATKDGTSGTLELGSSTAGNTVPLSGYTDSNPGQSFVVAADRSDISKPAAYIARFAFTNQG